MTSDIITWITVIPVSLASMLESMVPRPLYVLNAFSRMGFSTGPCLALSLSRSLTPSGLKINFSTTCLTAITSTARGIGYQRSPNLANCPGWITSPPCFTTCVVSKLSQVTLGGSQMSGSQNHWAAPCTSPAIPTQTELCKVEEVKWTAKQNY